MAKIPGENGEWQRVKGTYNYIDKNGQAAVGYGDHMVNLLSGDALTIRQFQNRQKAAKALLGQPVAARQPRDVGGAYYTRAHSEANMVRSAHGDIVVKYFRNMNEAQVWFATHYDPNDPFFQKYRTWVIQVRYARRNQVRFGTSAEIRRKSTGFATLSEHYTNSVTMANSSFPWDFASERLSQGFTLDNRSAIILFGGER